MTAAQPLSPQADVATTAVLTRTLVVSATPGTADIVATSLGRDPSLDVTARTTALADLVAVPPVDIQAIDLIIFDIRPNDADDLSAIEQLRALGHGGLKFLGVTGQTLTLAMSRALMDAGVDEVIPMASLAPQTPTDPALIAAPDDTASRRTGDLHNGLIIAACGARGGIGATSFTLNLATQLACRKHAKKNSTPPRIAVVDLDIQNGVLAASIDLADEGGMTEWLQSGDLPEEDFIPRTIKTYNIGGFDVLAAPTAFLPMELLRPEMLSALLDDLRLAYDFVILDMPRTLSDWAEAVLPRTDKLFVLSDHSVHALRQTRRLLDVFADEHADLPMDVLIAKEAKSNTTAPAQKEAETFLERKLSFWIPRDDKSARRAADAGEPILLNRPKSPIGKAMAPLVASLKDAQATNARRRG